MPELRQSNSAVSDVESKCARRECRDPAEVADVFTNDLAEAEELAEIEAMSESGVWDLWGSS